MPRKHKEELFEVGDIVRYVGGIAIGIVIKKKYFMYTDLHSTKYYCQVLWFKSKSSNRLDINEFVNTWNIRKIG